MHIEIPGGAGTSLARAFWGALFGWEFHEIPVASAQYLLARINEDQSAALSNFEPHKRGIRPYFTVANIDASIIRGTELRGQVYEKMAIPGNWLVCPLPRPSRQPIRALAERPPGRAAKPRSGTRWIPPR